MHFSVFNEKLYNRKTAIRSSLMFFSVISLSAILITYISYQSHLQNHLINLQEKHKLTLESLANAFGRRLNEPLNLIKLIASNPQWLNTSPVANQTLAIQFQRIMDVTPYFQQLRLIGLDGRELVRLNSVQGRVIQTKEEALQDKSKRYYVTEGLQLKPGEIYISPMDLNIENNKIELPLRPMLRFVTPAVDSNGIIRGLIVSNYNAGHLLKEIVERNVSENIDLMLLNEEGYWLFSPNKDERWGFMLEHDKKFARKNPEVWQKITNSETSHQTNHIGMFSHMVLNHTLTKSATAESKSEDPLSWHLVNPPHWYLVAFSNPEVMMPGFSSDRQILFLLALLFLLTLVPFSIAWGRRKAIQNYTSSRLAAYARVIDESHDLIYIVSKEGNILYANHAVVQEYGYALDEMIGNKPSLFKSGRHPDEFYQLLWNTLVSGENFEGIFVNKRKDGSLFFEAKLIMPLRMDHENDTVFVSIGKNLNLLYEKKQQEFRAANRLSAGIQHHFNNLLNGVVGYTQLAIMKFKKSDPESAKVMLDNSLEAALKIEDMVARLARISQSDARMKTLDINLLIDECISEGLAEIPASVKVDKNTIENDCTIKGNRKLLKMCVQSLLKNAVAHTDRQNGLVTISCEKMQPLNEICENCHEPIKGVHLAIHISDNGKGIAEDIRHEIFDPFFSTLDEANLVAETPGLGLTLVRSIVHIHKGHILLDTEINKGTTISILLPFLEDDPEDL